VLRSRVFPQRQLGDLPGDMESRIERIGGGGKAPERKAPAAAAGAGRAASDSAGAARVTQCHMFQLNGVAADSKAVLPGNPKRVYIEFSNESFVEEMRVNFSGRAGPASGTRIPPGGTRVWDVVVPVDVLHVFCASAGEPWSLMEGTPV